MNFEKYYKEIAKLHIVSETATEMRAHCPFHNDEKMSLSVNKTTGLWKCFGACAEGGNVWQFHIKMNEGAGMTIAGAKRDISIKLGEYKVLPLSIIKEAHEALKKNSKLLKFLIEERGLLSSTIEKYQLGTDGQRIYIPVFDAEGYIINIRKYKPCADEFKVISWGEGYGKAALYPVSNLQYDEVFLMEGELDCLLANTLGIKALTITCGASSAPQELLDKFRNKIVNICYDIDEAGKKGALNVASKLQNIARVRIINLPIKEPANGDFTDYIIRHKHSIEEFQQIVDNTPFLDFNGVSEKPTLDDTVYSVDLDESAQQNFYYKKVKMKVIVSGKDLAPYFAPQKLTLTCQQGFPKCKRCPLHLNNGRMVAEYELTTNEILELIRCSSDKQKLFIRKKLDLPNCNNFDIEINNIVNIEEIRVIPEINYSSKDMEYVTRNLYFIGYGIKTNRSYEIEGIVVPDPNNQYVTQLVTNANPTQSSIEQFKMTPEIYKRLSIFQPTCKESLHAKIDNINKDFTYNITKIYGREDLITAVDLVYHSVLQFRFQDQLVQKGWTDGLIIGDTRCGKTESLVQLIQHYRMGELCTGENISYAGLVGGMSQAQQRWSISWGKIPLNDRRLVVLDEVSSLDVDTISNLSALRSSGIAEIIKIQTERTNARTRLIWVSNPRSGRKLDTYNYGVLAIKELIGRVEDIARFDFAISISSDDVSIEEINKAHTDKVEHKYTADLCSELILWAWSRKPDQIKFTKEAEQLILDYALQLGKKYSPAIPLVEGAEQRIKIAKLSVAIAARTFSTDNGENIIVNTQHVQFIYDYLEKLYSKTSMGYDTFSLLYRQTTKLDNETADRLGKEFINFNNSKTLKELLLEFQAFRKTEVSDQMGYDQDETKQLFKWLTMNKFIKSTPIGYVKQPIFTSFLKGLNITEGGNANEFNI